MTQKKKDRDDTIESMIRDNPIVNYWYRSGRPGGYQGLAIALAQRNDVLMEQLLLADLLKCRRVLVVDADAGSEG